MLQKLNKAADKSQTRRCSYIQETIQLPHKMSKLTIQQSKSFGYTRRDLHDSIEGTRVSTRQMEEICSQNQEESNKRTWIAQFD